MRHVYMFEDILCKSFGDYHFEDCDFDTYTRRLHTFAVLCPNEARDIHHLYQQMKVHYVGTFDEATGVLTYDTKGIFFDLAADLAQLDALRRQATDGGSN